MTLDQMIHILSEIEEALEEAEIRTIDDEQVTFKSHRPMELDVYIDYEKVGQLYLKGEDDE